MLFLFCDDWPSIRSGSISTSVSGSISVSVSLLARYRCWLGLGLGPQIIKGKRRIQQLASALQLHAHHADAAVRLFRLAVQHNFTAGRRSVEVVAACLYTVFS